MTQQNTPPSDKTQRQEHGRKHLVKGITKSIPFVGNLLDEMMFETAKSEADAQDKRTLYTALTTIQQQQQAADTDMADVILHLQQLDALTQQTRDFLRMIALYLKGQADADTSRFVETAADRAIEKHVANLEIVRGDYLKFIVDDCGRLEPRGIPQTVRAVTLPLDKVYVSLMAEREQEQPRIRTWGGIAERDAQGNIIIPDFPENELVRREVVRQNVGLPQAVTGNLRIVMLGKPGAGKTTLTRFLAARFACALRDGQQQVTDGDGRAYGDARLPIRIRIADYADAFRKDHSLALRAFLVHGCHHAKCPHEQLAALFDDALQTGQTFLLLDGLDEVADAPTRTEIARRIETFLSDLETGNRVLVTSRIAGYAEAWLDDRFTALTLQDMERAQIEQFLHRWCAAVERFHDTDAAEDEIARLGALESAALLKVIDASPGVQRLAVNPLLLTILALIHRQNTRLPEHRIELYELATKTLLRDWLVAQAGAEGRVISRDEEEILLWPLAQWMHEEYETGRVPETDVRRKLRELYAESRSLKKNDPNVIREVEDFLKRVTEHSGLFVPYPPDEYGFLHLTFEEYMTGRALVSDDEIAADNLRKYRHKARWEEPLRLAISGQTGKTAANLIRKAIWSPEGARRHKEYEPSEYEDILRRDLFLTARCLSDCEAVEPILAREIAAELVAICLNQNDNGKYEPLQELAHTTLGMLRYSEAGTEAHRLLLVALKDTNENVRSAAASALGKIGQESSEALYALTDALTDKDWQVRRAAAQAMNRIRKGSPEVLRALLVALKDTDESVRKAAAAALDQIGQQSSEALNILIADIADTEEYMRIAAALGLVTDGQKIAEIVHSLVEALQDTYVFLWARPLSRPSAVGQEATEALRVSIAALQDTDLFVRRKAAATLDKIGSGSVQTVHALLAALEDTDFWVQHLAKKALGKIACGSIQALYTLRDALSTPDESVRNAVVEALGTAGRGSEVAYNSLLDALQDTNENVRSTAVSALVSIRHDATEMLHILLQSCKDQASIVRTMAAQALGTVGQGSAEALNALLNLIHDEDWNVRNVAWTSLNQLVQA